MSVGSCGDPPDSSIDVDLDDVACQWSTSGRIGNLILDDLPCMLSEQASNRVTTPSVGAISVDAPYLSRTTWLGINQNAANRRVRTRPTHYPHPDRIHAATV